MSENKVFKLSKKLMGAKKSVPVPNIEEMSAKDVRKFYDIGEDIPLDLIKLSGVMDISVLPKDLWHMYPDNDFLCVFVTNDQGRKTLFYSDSLMDTEFSEFPVIVHALVRYMCIHEKNFYITHRTHPLRSDIIYELLMPEDKVDEILNKQISPTTYSLARIFRVPQEFVRKRLDVMETTKQIAGYNY